jgi:cell division protein FtsI/penicillin-binding protein 2
VRHLAGAIVIQDVETGALVVFASAAAPADARANDGGAVDVGTAVLPLSTAKVLLAASWWEHESAIRAAGRELTVDVNELIALGSDSDGRRLAAELRGAEGSEAVLSDLNRFGFLRCGSEKSTGKDEIFWKFLAAKWRPRLVPVKTCVALTPQTSEEEWDSAFSIGEADFSVTLLQLSRFMQAVGNGGVMLGPVARAIGDKARDKNGAAIAGSRIMLATTAAKLQAAMRDTVERGTAKGIRGRLGSAWSMGGKTGSGPGDARPLDGCFAGLVFDENKIAKYSFAIYVKRGGVGGGAAAEVAADVVKVVLGM